MCERLDPQMSEKLKTEKIIAGLREPTRQMVLVQDPDDTEELWGILKRVYEGHVNQPMDPIIPPANPGQENLHIKSSQEIPPLKLSTS